MPRRKNKKHQGKPRNKQPSLKLLNLQSLLLRESKKLALLIFVSGLPLYVYVITIPEQKRLDALRLRLSESQKEEQLAMEANDRITREISAYRSNPEYLEIIARDHLNYFKEGETIIRIER